MDALDVRRNRPARSNVREPLRESASQTAGPFVHIGCMPNGLGIGGIFPHDLLFNRPLLAGERVRITGRVFDGDQAVSRDAIVEAWQADPNGSYANGLWQRTWTDFESGEFTFETVRPGATDGLAPFVYLWVASRGLNRALLTRCYFPDCEEGNAVDPHLALVPASRRGTLIAAPGGGANAFRFDIYLQGERETVFFDV